MAIVPPLGAHVVSPYTPPGIVQNLVGAADALREAIGVCYTTVRELLASKLMRWSRE